MDKATVEKRLADYEAELRRREADIYRLQGAIAALKQLLAEDTKPEEAAE